MAQQSRNRFWPDRRLARLAGLALLLTQAFAGPVQAAQLAAVLPVEPAGAGLMALRDRPDDQLYVVSLRLDRMVLSEAMIVYLDGEQLLLPLGDLFDALEFPIAVDPEAGRAEGWFLDEDRRFVLDLAAATFAVEGEEERLEPGAAERQIEDLYATAEALEDWFPVLIDFDLGDLAIEITPRETMPIQERLAREERRRGLHPEAEADLPPRLEQEEVWFSWPFVDTSVEYATSRQRRVMDHQGRLSTTVAAVVAGLDSAVTVNATNGARPNVRLRAGRKDPAGGLLGGVDAREFALGDVATPNLPLIAQSTPGRGAEVSTFDLDRLSQTNRVTLRGDIPVGWEVEVYRNNELLAFQTASDIVDGRYEFRDLETLAGLNLFRLVFFGPQGQRREEVRRYFVTADLAEPGSLGLRLVANQQNRDLIDTRDSEDARGDDGALRFLAEAEYGLSDTVSLSGGLASFSLDDDRRFYGLAGARASWFGALNRLDLAVGERGGGALALSSQSRIEGVSLFAEYARFHAFQSERSEAERLEGDLTGRATLRADGHVPDFGLGHLPFGLSAVHETGPAGVWSFATGGRLSAAVQPFNVSLRADAALTDEEAVEADGRFLIGTRVQDVRLRGEVTFGLAPEASFQSAVVNSDWPLGDGFGLRLGLRHNAGSDPSQTLATVGLNRDFETFALGFNLDANDAGDFNARLGLSFGVGIDPRDHRPAVRSQSVARNGAFTLLVYLDRDNDGVLGDGDEVLPGVGFAGPRIPKNVRTRDNGTALMLGIQPYRDIEIRVDEATLENPFWVPVEDRLRTVARPGSATFIAFPIIETAEVDGYVTLERGARELAAPGVRVQVIDADGDVVAQGRSAYDGYYLVNRFPYGRYRLRIHPEDLRNLGYAPADPQGFSVTPEEPFLAGQDFLLRPAG